MICITENVLKRRFPFTAGSGLVRFLGHIFDQGFWPGFLGQKDSVQFFWDGETQFYSSTGTQKYSFTALQGQKNTVLQV